MVPEDLLDESARNASAFDLNGNPNETEEERAARLASQPPDMLIQWKAVLRISVVVCAAISLACLVLPLELMAWLAPGIVLGFYTTRHRETKITSGMGARIGLVCGILCAFGITVTKTIQMLILRYVAHQGASLDALLTQQIVQAKARAVAQSGAVAAAAIFDPLLKVAEFRVGFYMVAVLFGCLLLMAFSTLSGAFSGYMRSRRTGLTAGH
ncbi:MAG: hypothetical protein ABI142_11085 [Bryocella sp.]